MRRHPTRDQHVVVPVTYTSTAIGQTPSKDRVSLGQSSSNQSLQGVLSERTLAPSISVTSLMSTPSDTGGATAIGPPRSTATALSGEALQPYLSPAGVYAQQLPPRGYGQGPAQMVAAPPPGHPQVFVAQPQYQPPRAVMPGGAQQVPMQAQVYTGSPVWVIEEVVDFGTPIDDIDSSRSMGMSPMICRPQNVLLSSCLRPNCVNGGKSTDDEFCPY